MKRAHTKYAAGQVHSGVTLLAHQGGSLWQMRCHCGRVFVGKAHYVGRGIKPHCGCRTDELRRAANRTHGHYANKSSSPIATVYTSMKSRCYNPNYAAFPAYGGKGITICAAWLDGIENFARDMGPRPAGTTLDRIDPAGNYEPSNCRWATGIEQARNKLRALHAPDGRHLKEFAEAEGLSYQRLRAYWKRHNIPFDEAVAKARGPRKNYKRRQDWG